MKAGLAGHGSRHRVKKPCRYCGAKWFPGKGPGNDAKSAKEAGQFSRRQMTRDCPGRST
jgi:hypothetical protein